LGRFKESSSGAGSVELHQSKAAPLSGGITQWVSGHCCSWGDHTARIRPWYRRTGGYYDDSIIVTVRVVLGVFQSGAVRRRTEAQREGAEVVLPLTSHCLEEFLSLHHCWCKPRLSVFNVDLTEPWSSLLHHPIGWRCTEKWFQA
jgi:hypothetical protein